MRSHSMRLRCRGSLSMSLTKGVWVEFCEEADLIFRSQGPKAA